MANLEPDYEGKEFTLTIEELNSRAEGIGKIDGFLTFVPFTLPGEIVRVRVSEQKSGFAVAEPVELLQGSPERVSSFCPHYHECGECHTQHMKYDLQLEFKRNKVEEALVKLAAMREPQVGATIPAKLTKGYRNGARFEVDISRKELVLGFYRVRSERVVDLEECPLLTPLANEVYDVIRSELSANKGEQGKRLHESGLRAVEIQAGTRTGKASVNFIVEPGAVKEFELLAKFLVAEEPRIAGVYRTVDSGPQSAFDDTTPEVLARDEDLYEELGGFRFRISPSVYFRANTLQTERLVEKVLEVIRPEKGMRVIDSHCGTGLFSLPLASLGVRVAGIEGDRLTASDGLVSLVQNRLHGLCIYSGAADDMLPKLLTEGYDPALILLDPPKGGCTSRVTETVRTSGVPRVVYVSSNPAPLARDLALLAHDGYELVQVTPLDMYPQTHQTDCVAVLERKK